jgi:hypothetical protein
MQVVVEIQPKKNLLSIPAVETTKKPSNITIEDVPMNDGDDKSEEYEKTPIRKATHKFPPVSKNEEHFKTAAEKLTEEKKRIDALAPTTEKPKEKVPKTSLNKKVSFENKSRFKDNAVEVRVRKDHKVVKNHNSWQIATPMQ